MKKPGTENWSADENLCGEKIMMVVTCSTSGARHFRGVSGKIYNELGRPVSRDEAPDAYKTLEPNCRPATEAEKLMAIAKFNAQMGARQYA